MGDYMLPALRLSQDDLQACLANGHGSAPSGGGCNKDLDICLLLLRHSLYINLCLSPKPKPIDSLTSIAAPQLRPLKRRIGCTEVQTDCRRLCWPEGPWQRIGRDQNARRS